MKIIIFYYFLAFPTLLPLMKKSEVRFTTNLQSQLQTAWSFLDEKMNCTSINVSMCRKLMHTYTSVVDSPFQMVEENCVFTTPCVLKSWWAMFLHVDSQMISNFGRWVGGPSPSPMKQR